MPLPLAKQLVAWLICLPLRLFIRNVSGTLPPGPCVVACSHGSLLDGPFVSIILWPRRMRALVMERYAHGAIGLLLRLADVIWVRKDAPGLSVDEAVAAARKRCTIIIFPEGRCNANKVERPKTGAARIAMRANLPVVPLKLTASHLVLPPDSAVPRFRRTDIVIGKPIDTRGYSVASARDRHSLTKKIAAAINAL